MNYSIIFDDAPHYPVTFAADSDEAAVADKVIEAALTIVEAVTGKTLIRALGAGTFPGFMITDIENQIVAGG